MPAQKRLLTGPPGAVLREHALREAATDSSSLWVVPTPLARDQVIAALALKYRLAGSGPRVYCWDDLWRAVRGGVDDGPVWLSEAGSRAVFLDALNQAREQGRLKAVAEVIDWPGFRRRLREQFKLWTLAERFPREGIEAPAAGDEPATAAAWAVFIEYRRLLQRLRAEDDAGISVWASKRLIKGGPSGSRQPRQITFLDFERPSLVHWRVLEQALQRAASVQVTLAYESDPTVAEVYLATAPVRSRLLESGFVEQTVSPEVWRPAGLRGVERSLFRDRTTVNVAIGATGGIAVRGAPEGDGVGRLLASEVRGLLERGVAAEDILVLFPAWSEQADLVVEAFRAWGLPVHAELRRTLETEPAIAALHLAITLPREDWETERVVRLFRNGQLRPVWPRSDPARLAAAAAAIKSTLVFRGSAQLRRGLDRALVQALDQKNMPVADRLRLARDLVDRLVELIEPLVHSRAWSGHAAQLRRVAECLGLGGPDEAVLETLWNALEDHGAILDRIGRGDEPISWLNFVSEFESLVAETRVMSGGGSPGAIRLAAVDEVTGARAAHVFLAELTEGTFPSGNAVRSFLKLGPGEIADLPSKTLFAHEMLRFLHVLGSADESVTLVYPTTDAKGQELLRAGFLDDLLALLTPEAAAVCHSSHARFHPALLDQGEFAGSPADARVRAAALAGERGDTRELSRLARDPSHRRILEGTAAALRMLQGRQRGTPFSEFEGKLTDGAAILEIDSNFSADYRFSPSQLETYLACPFQFFSKYVLKLNPIQERDELEEDYTERGSRIHDILENFETLIQQRLPDQSIDQLVMIALNHVLEVEFADPTDLDQGLQEIEQARLTRDMQCYVAQRAGYEGEAGQRVIPRCFEVNFGRDGSEHPMLEIGQGSRVVKLSGTIDRIDLVETVEGVHFRVIDYKSGSTPSTAQVKRGEMLQLLIYAMAVERLILRDEVVGPLDVGYWGLKKEGYKPIVIDGWDAVQNDLVCHVLAVVGQLRQGVFVVDSRKEGCESFCDFRTMCRVRQIRGARKSRGDVLMADLSVQPRKRGGTRTKAASGFEVEPPQADVMRSRPES